MQFKKDDHKPPKQAESDSIKSEAIEMFISAINSLKGLEAFYTDRFIKNASELKDIKQLHINDLGEIQPNELDKIAENLKYLERLWIRFNENLPSFSESLQCVINGDSTTFESELYPSELNRVRQESGSQRKLVFLNYSTCQSKRMRAHRARKWLSKLYEQKRFSNNLHT